MCLKPKVPKTPKAQPAPDRDTVQENVSRTRRAAATQQGIYGNVFTSALGDSNYGSSTSKVATLGGAA